MAFEPWAELPAPQYSGYRMSKQREVSRRQFVAGMASALCMAGESEDVVDIHGHPGIPAYHSEKWVLQHQRHHGIKTTMLLPIPAAAGVEKIGGLVNLLPKFTLGQGSAQRLAKTYPGEFCFFANADARRKDASKQLENDLQAGAIGIGEVKLPLACDAPEMERIYDVARAWKVPVLIHFQHRLFATGIERFHKVAARYPGVMFIGHAQTWWSNMGRTETQTELYPRGPVKPGGFTDILLTAYPNVYADLSGASGFGAVARDREHWKSFATRHQDQLLFGSDCEHKGMEAEVCWAGRTKQLVRMMGPSEAIVRKILSGNARRLLRPVGKGIGVSACPCGRRSAG